MAPAVSVTVNNFEEVPTSLQPSTSPQRLKNTSSWPHRWVNSGNVTAFSIDITMVTINKLKNIIAATLDHLGGRQGGVSDYAPDYVQATMDTNLTGKLTISLTTKPSKAEAFKAMGCRIYFRGIPKAQRELPEVTRWMSEMVRILSP